MIPVNEPLVGEREAELTLECVRSGWISSEGEWVRRFESAWADYCGVTHGVAISNGTAALFAAVAALGLAPGDEVIMPTFTIISCAHAVAAAGAKPVLVDSDPETWCMQVDNLETQITDRTRAIMPVHIYGHPVEMDPVRRVAEAHNLRIVEDAAEAHGAEYRGVRAGALGDLSCFSFYANKIITTGEGGMVLTDDPELAERVRSYVNLAFRKERRFYHTETGYNHRLTSLQAAVGLAQIENVEWRVNRKREIAQRYLDRLQGIEGLTLPVERPWAKNVYWMFGVVVDHERLGFSGDELTARLAARGVASRPFFLGMHDQPVFRERGWFDGERFPVADRLARDGIYLPSGLALSDDDVDRVCEAVRDTVSP